MTSEFKEKYYTFFIWKYYEEYSSLQRRSQVKRYGQFLIYTTFFKFLASHCLSFCFIFLKMP